jgi:AcrR family transcriptional regulator
LARPQAADYEQRREAIVEHAAELFARHGFRGASVADLAVACDTSKSLIYHYYPSKEDVLYVVMEAHIDELLKEVRRVTGTGASAERMLKDLIAAFMRHYVGASSRHKVLLNELGNLPEAKRAVIVDKQRRIIAAVQDLLQQIDPALADDTARSRVQTMLLFGMINWTHTWFDPAGPIGADALSTIVADQIMAGLNRGNRPS